MRTVIEIKNEKYVVRSLAKSRFCAMDACDHCKFIEWCGDYNSAPCREFDNDRFWAYLARV